MAENTKFYSAKQIKLFFRYPIAPLVFDDKLYSKNKSNHSCIFKTDLRYIFLDKINNILNSTKTFVSNSTFILNNI